MKTQEQNVHTSMESTLQGVSKRVIAAGLLSLALMTAACGQKPANFSLQEGENRFQQDSAELLGKMDILFVIDNSGSMESSQEQIAQNFRRFIELFDEKGFDYRIAVTTSDAYRDLFGAPSTISRFRDGTDQTGHTGTFVITPLTPNIESTFMTNIRQGIDGNGDERAFQSIERTLSNPMNAGFPRPDAFLSVIIVSDEDDFSWDGSTAKGGQYSFSGLHKTERYVNFLDTLTGATEETRRTKYHVNSIAIMDEACRKDLENTFTGRKIGYRYMELSNATKGTVANLCGDFGTSLSNISVSIVNAITEFFLDREPVESTLVVTINGQPVPRLSLDASDAADGFKYHPEKNSITFHGASIPGPSASIAVKFDPARLK